MPNIELAFFSPGQGPAIDPSWIDDSAASDVIESIQKSVPPGVNVGNLLELPASEREVSSLNAHILLATMMGIASARIRPELEKRSYVVTGHSAGLSNSLGMTGFYADGTEGLGRAMVERGRILSKIQQITPGEMFMVSWKGISGFQKMGEWVLEQNKGKSDGNIWLACLNLDNGEGANVIMTAKKGSNMQEKLKGEFGDRVEITPLPIALGAHSPLVLGAEEKYREYLQFQFNQGKIGNTGKCGVAYVSDHIPPGQSRPIYTSDAQSIIFDLSRLHLPVEFQRTIEYIAKELGVRTIVELGSRHFGTLIKKMGLDNIETISVRNPRELDELVTKLANHRI